jgi:tetratricopeptide (TPR) repeat protein
LNKYDNIHFVEKTKKLFSRWFISDLLYKLCSFWLLLLFMLHSQGCKKLHIRSDPPKQSVITLDPLVFVARKGKVVHIERLSDEELFDKGGQEFRAGNYQAARTYYYRIIEYKPTSSYAEYALYNLGLSCERLKDFKCSIHAFTTILKRQLDDKTRTDARFRLAASYLGAEQWSEAKKLYRELLTLPKLNLSDRFELLANLGIALQEQNQAQAALMILQQAVTLYRRASQDEYIDKSYFVALAQFRIGLHYERLFRFRQFRTKLEEMKQDLNDKAANLLTAQAHYMRAIRIRNPEVIAISLFHIGDMYRQMYDDMLKAPTPKLSQAEYSMYECMLKQRIRVLLDRAIYAFERNIQTAESLGLQDDQWIRKTERSLHELREKIIKEYYSESAVSCAKLLDPKTPDNSTNAAATTDAPAKQNTTTKSASSDNAPSSRPNSNNTKLPQSN